MKFISWNVNGLRACVGKGFLDFFKEANADIFCLQETKLQAGQIDLELPGYHQYWNYAEKRKPFGSLAALVWKSMTMRAACLPWNIQTSILLPFIRPIPKMNWRAWITA